MVRLNRIYTRTGDDGTTGLVDGSRRRKDDPRLTAIGSVDEANATIGLARRHATGPHDEVLARVQNDLFDLGADLATPESPDMTGALRITAPQVTALETALDGFNDDLSPLTSFILPAGTDLSAHLHMARTIARRAERDAVTLAAAEDVNPEALKYLNRLSDLLFVMARHANGKGLGDVLWVPGASRT